MPEEERRVHVAPGVLLALLAQGIVSFFAGTAARIAAFVVTLVAYFALMFWSDRIDAWLARRRSR